MSNIATASTEAVMSHCGDLADRCSNSIPNIAKHLGLDNDEIDIGLLSSTLIQEPDIIDSCLSTDELMRNTAISTVEELNGPAVEMPDIEVQQSSSCVLMPNPCTNEEPIIQRSDDANSITTVAKPKRRSAWKRTKRFFRKLFCCGDVKVQHSSSGILVKPTNSAGEKIDFGSLPVMEEPILTDSPIDPQTTSQVKEISGPVETDVQQFRCDLKGPQYESYVPMLIPDVETDSVGDKVDFCLTPNSHEQILMDSPQFAEDFLQQTTLKVEEFNDPIETNVQQSDSEPIDPQTTSQVEEISGLVETDLQQFHCDLKGPPYECFVPMLIPDVEPDSVGDKVDFCLTPNTHEQILMDLPRCADEVQQQTSLPVEEISSPVGTDVKNSSCDPVGSVSNVVTPEAKPKRRTLWKRLFGCVF